MPLPNVYVNLSEPVSGQLPLVDFTNNPGLIRVNCECGVRRENSMTYDRFRCGNRSHVLNLYQSEQTFRPYERFTMKTRITTLVALAVILTSVNAFACGDSLYRVGKGVSYRTYSAPLPGNLLVFGTSEGAKQLAEELARSGHGVHLVGSADELTSELDKGGYDVVIAPYSERAMIDGSSGASFLPIAVNGEEERLAKESYGRVMVPEKHEIKHYLKAIHRALKNNA
jgi:hypothetical protein